jgi:hypothetical protein
MIYHEIEEYVPKLEKPNSYRNPKIIKGFQLDPMPYKWTLYNHGEILTYGYCHSRKQAEEVVMKELLVRTNAIR